MSPTPTELHTDRLLLRRWRPEDRAPFADLNADPVVMEHFVACLTRAESDDLIDRVEDHFDAEVYGLWAVDITATGQFVGVRRPLARHLRRSVHPGGRGRLATGPARLGLGLRH